MAFFSPFRAAPLLAAAVTLGASFSATSVQARQNPFFKPSSLQYEYPRFDLIRDEDYAPALEKGMADQLKEMDKIARNRAAPTFENTVVAMERTGQLLERVSTVFDNLKNANTDPVLQQVERTEAPKLSAQTDEIHLNPVLFARIRGLYEQRATLHLDPESLRLLERYYEDFVRAGANLKPADQHRLKELNGELAGLSATFGQNVLKEKNASEIVVEHREELAGLSDAEIAGLEANAKAEHLPGKYIIHLLNTTGQPLLRSLQNRALRERIMEASLARGTRGGPYDNQTTVVRIAQLRAERAALLGFPNHAAYQVANQTAKTVDALNHLLAQLGPPAVAHARQEAAAMQKIVDREQGGFAVAAWDWDFYSDRVRREKYAFDESQLKPYFELNHVLQDGVFYAAHELYGLTFKERHDLPVYRPEVRVFEIFDADGTSLALFMEDFYARDSKQGGAWMNQYVAQSRLLGRHAVIGNQQNIPQPAAGQPTLLTFAEVTTLFREFGHALHGMFSAVEYPMFSGTRVPRDFVEYPSQVNEMWAAWPDVVRHYAKHYQTGAPIPPALLDKMVSAQKFNQGFATTEYLEAALLDQAWHQKGVGQVPTNVPAFEQQALQSSGVWFPPVPPRYRSTYLAHSFSGGYSAGYYSYIWADVLVADSIEWFTQHGGLKRENGERFRSTLLSRGGTDDAMTLFEHFNGTGPEIAPLLRRRGFDEAPAEASAKTGDDDAASTDAPHYGQWGFDLTGRDLAVKPGDDFYDFANGLWYRAQVIPPDRIATGMLDKLAILTQNQTRLLITRAGERKDDEAAVKIAAAFQSFLDEDRVEQLDARPLTEELDEIREEKTPADVVTVMGRAAQGFQSSLFEPSIGIDAKSPDQYAVSLSVGGLGLPDRDYYLTADLADKKALYLKYVAEMLGLIGWEDPAGGAQKVVDWETRIATVTWTRAARRDRDKTYNPVAVSDLSNLAPGFDFRSLLRVADLADTDRVIVPTTSTLTAAARIFAATPLTTIQAWQAFHLADSAAPYLSRRFVSARFEFRNHALAGQPEMQPRWKRGVNFVNGAVGELVGKEYVAAYFPPSSKAKMDALVKELISALSARIAQLDWMTPATKAKAQEKLSLLTVKIGYPVRWKTYAELSLKPDDLYGNVERSDNYNWEYDVHRLHGPVDKQEWLMTPQTINAYYYPPNNEIVFPAAFLQPPFFDPKADMAVNYGGIGGVIGHEMTHGFDDQGRKSDGHGMLKDWWTAEDAAKFKVQADKLGAQYSQFEPVKGFHVNGQLTMGENIADLGGLLLAIDAYHASLHGQPAPVIDGLTGDQRVFLGWAQAWRQKIRDAAAVQYAKMDPHSPAHFRVNGTVRNNPAWYDAFGIKPGDPMYVAPADRVHIW